jgi:hypothetical protein
MPHKNIIPNALRGPMPCAGRCPARADARCPARANAQFLIFTFFLATNKSSYSPYLLPELRLASPTNTYLSKAHK